MATPGTEPVKDLVDAQNFKKLVSLIDKLRDIGLNDHISMPRIAVLGSQSSGKSSLLESIVGLNFLPRGSGVVTRRPLELRLCRVREMKEKPYGVFAQDPETKLTDFVEIRKRIEKYTDDLCGSNKNIIDDPIVLKIYSENTPDLTLIDLPGITRIPVGGQPKNIEEVTKSLVTRYCKDERTIILAVIPANADMSNSDSLQMAQHLDPQGIRTVGVITKIDIMDKGTDAKKMLLNKEIPLKLGYIGVKGRSQADVDSNMTVSEALKEELSYFSSHPVYRHLPKEILGTEFLVRKLTTVMYDHIRRVLPTIMKEIEFKISSTEKNIANLGVPIPSDHKEKLDQIWREISLFYDKFKANVKGEYVEVFRKSDKQEGVLASAQINLLYNDLYKSYMLNIKYSSAHSDSDIAKIVDMYSGNTIPGFIRVDCFIALLSPLVENLRAPALELLEKVYMLLKTIGSRLMSETFSKVFSIKEVLLDLFDKILNECRDSTADYINKFLDCQTKVIFTKDPNFITNSVSWPEELQKKDAALATNESVANRLGTATSAQNGVKSNSVPPQKTEQKQTLDPKERRAFMVKEMRKRIDQYFQINMRQIADSVPKMITNFLINELLDKIYFSMFRKVADPEVLEEIKEPQSVIDQRKYLEETLKSLSNSKKVLLKDPDLNFVSINTDAS